MSAGKLASVTVTNTTTTTIYTVPAGKVACVDLHLIQPTGTTNVDATIYVGNGSTNNDMHKLASIGSTAANRWNITSGILMNAGEQINVKLSNSATILCTVRGIEEDE